ncbi:HAMP domain-containing protein [Leptolyngbya sp. FACHB-541]|uniref:methyl-accepting chemotaxis protein n=1 Tax=Leptolyngbya sp. FACHB-541 TaxID=2692810 RepID=UPI001681DA9C|nr:cache domain-containing protein [Leptolyngbya sp. FACHB-541]MBD1997046.1 HAMP domain-containing protein [Leptolyngbya sp. FACHB-541]
MPAQHQNVSDSQQNTPKNTANSAPSAQTSPSPGGPAMMDIATSKLRQSIRRSGLNLSKDYLLGRGLSIGVKATILATVFGVLPVSMVGWYAYRSGDSAITQQIAEEKLLEANQLSDQVSRFLEERLANIKTVATIAHHLIEDEGVGNLSATSPQRAVLEQAASEEFTTFVQDYRTYSSIALYDLQGEVIAQSQGSARELNQKDAAYFQQVLSTEQAVVSEPSTTTGVDGTERLSIYVAAPVADESGRTIAVVAARIPVEYVGNAVLRTASLREGTTYRLVDSSGNVFQDLPDTDSNALGGAIAEAVPLFPEVSAEKRQQAWLAESATGEQLNAYAPIRTAANLDWSVVTSVESNVAFVPQGQLLRAIALGTVLTALVAAALGAFLAKRATDPIQRVTKTVEKLGQGELEARIPVRGSDEFAILGANVNQMAAQIQNLLQTLRQNSEQLSHQNDMLASLAQNEALIQGDAQEVAKAFTETIAQTIQVDCVSIWVYTSDRTGLTCLDQYDHSTKQHKDADILTAIHAKEYFQAIDTVIATTNAIANPAIYNLFANEKIASGIQSVLNIPIQIGGQTAGVIRCDRNAERAWQADEQTFVTSVANLVSIAIESEILQQEVSHLLDVVSEVEEGDLTTQARVSDRTTGLVADTFNRLIERLTDVVTQVVEAAQQVSEGANQQKAMAEVVATNTEQQAQAVTQVLQLTEQVEQMAQSSAEKARATTTSLESVRLTVEQGQGAIATLTQGIEVLQEGTNRIVQQMKTLGEFVGLADQFVQEQSQIASLTQTLALNASLVAARASEQRDPRQFAVVAREFDSIANQVGRLAQQTNEGLVTLEQRSTQIHSVVSIIDANIQNLGGLVRGFTEGVDQSSQVFNSVQVVTEETVNAGEAVTQSSQAIVNAAQSAAQVVRDIAEIATQTAGLSQRTRIQSEKMNLLSNQLLQSIEFFQLPTLKGDKTVIQTPVDLSQAKVPTVDISANTTDRVEMHLSAQTVPKRSL